MSVLTNTIDSALDFRIYCEGLERQHIDRTYSPLDEYFKDEDFQGYQAARAWWPKDAPASLLLPTLEQLAQMRQLVPGVPNPTFAEILSNMGKRCVTWLETEGRDVQYPNETKPERKARKAREATARHRTKGTSTNPAATAARAHARELYNRYMATCDARRAAVEEHTTYVHNALAAYEAAAAEAKRLEDE
jgi:hypothetical protein